MTSRGISPGRGDVQDHPLGHQHPSDLFNTAHSDRQAVTCHCFAIYNNLSGRVNRVIVELALLSTAESCRPSLRQSNLTPHSTKRPTSCQYVFTILFTITFDS